MTSCISHQLQARLPSPLTVKDQYTKPQATQHIASHFCALPVCGCMLQSLDVGYNQFSGSFNALLGNCEYIVSFQADGNMLSGPLPANMASLGLMVCLQTAHRFVPLVTLHTVSCHGAAWKNVMSFIRVVQSCHVYLCFPFKLPFGLTVHPWPMPINTKHEYAF